MKNFLKSLLLVIIVLSLIAMPTILGLYVGNLLGDVYGLCTYIGLSIIVTAILTNQ